MCRCVCVCVRERDCAGVCVGVLCGWVKRAQTTSSVLRTLPFSSLPFSSLLFPSLLLPSRLSPSLLTSRRPSLRCTWKVMVFPPSAPPPRGATRLARAPIGRSPSIKIAKFVTTPPCSKARGGVSVHPPAISTRAAIRTSTVSPATIAEAPEAPEAPTTGLSTKREAVATEQAMRRCAAPS